MKLEIRTQNGEVDEVLRAHVERRLRFALGRFGAQIGRVTVRFAPSDGVPRGADSQCRIVVTAVPSGIVVWVEDSAATPYAAVDRAAERAGRLFERELARVGAISGP